MTAPSPDPLDHPDPRQAADHAATETLLRAYVRETGTPVPPTGQPLHLTLPATGLTLTVPVRHHSPTGWHRFGPATLAAPAGETAPPADTALVAAATLRETTLGRGQPPHLGADAAARVLTSAHRTAAHLTARRAEPPGTTAPTPFLDAEQALLLGHPFHPAPKSREEATHTELDTYSPELRGSFPLHWFAAHPDIVTGETLTGTHPADHLHPYTRDLPLPPGTLPLPAHPWQARDILTRPAVRALIDAGLLHPLGPHGDPWHPTSSLRTVHRPDAAHQLKLSLGMRITNSRRNNLRAEMRLGVRAARLLNAGPGAWLTAHHPTFTILRDPAWITAGHPDDDTETGLETALRDNPFHGSETDALCVAGLLAERTGPGDGTAPTHRAALAAAVHRTATTHTLTTAQAANLWLTHYLHHLATPLIALHAHHGIALEPHHQNTLITLGPDGLPRAGWYRDSQGYYLTATHADHAETLLPGITHETGLVFDDTFVNERVAYYLGINNLLGLIGAMGALHLADETDLLATLHTHLTHLRTTHPGAQDLLDLLLDAPTLRCKGNYLTCADGLDELVGDVHTQSIYIDLPNPIAEAKP
ncbi:iron transporter [Streptomyces sp. JJ66]|uniref:IucA/IucC family protein n=1 Tax=Streptomyces sp. JJ66 TaxID=2803843 RepID=UPI001C59A892|nr:IucA/IucC family protein [Streptomyces sp. JJ66]MBW1604627.1 iron transporter [Streptomyces sp. JJ66]